MYSLVLWGKRGNTSSVLRSEDIAVKKGITKAKWQNKWLPARIIIKSGMINNYIYNYLQCKNNKKKKFYKHIIISIDNKKNLEKIEVNSDGTINCIKLQNLNSGL